MSEGPRMLQFPIGRRSEQPTADELKQLSDYLELEPLIRDIERQARIAYLMTLCDVNGDTSERLGSLSLVSVEHLIDMTVNVTDAFYRAARYDAWEAGR